jgi:hypothetical protein
MPLYGFNKTTEPLALAAGKNYPFVIITLEPSDAAGSLGPEYDVTRELRDLTAPQQAAIEAQVTAGDLALQWSGTPEFSLGTVPVTSPSTLQIYATEAARDAATPSEGDTAIVGNVEQHFSGGAWRNADGSPT